MSQDALACATGTDDKELFLIEDAQHIETYWVDRYVDAAVDKLTAFYARTLWVRGPATGSRGPISRRPS